MTIKLGLDQPLVVRYLHWIGSLLSGDFGRSTAYDIPVSDLILQRMAVTLPLAVMAMALAGVLAVPLGVAAAVRKARLAPRTDITWMTSNIPPAVKRIGRRADLAVCMNVITMPQARVREIARDAYSNTPNGVLGNEDCGQMSAWYVFAALGFYPLNPTSTEFAIGSPLFGRERMLERLADRGQVRRAAGADGDLGHPLAGQQPGQHQARHRGAPASGNRAEPVEGVEGPASGELLVRPGALVHPRPGRERLAAVVLTGQPAAGQRA